MEVRRIIGGLKMIKNFKKLHISLLMVVLIVVLAACGGDSGNSGDDSASTEGSGDDVVTLSYGHYFSEEDIHGREAIHFKELVEEKSDGSIQIDLFPNEQLVAGEDGFQATASGTVDMYLSISSYISGQVPLVDIYNIPFPHPDYDDRMLAEFAEAADPIYEDQMLENNVKNLGMISTVGSTSFYLTKPAYTMEDLKGMNIRGAGGLSDKGMSLIGISPTFMAAAEQYMALQTGTVDGVMTAYTSFDSMNLHEVAPFWLRANIIKTPYFLLMNNDKWESLTEEQQEILIEATRETRDWVLDEFEVFEAEIAEVAEENVDEMYELPEEEWEKWNDTIQPLYEEYIEENGEAGEELVEMLEEYSGID